MLQALIGQKVDQTQTFLEDGKRIPVTEVSVTDNIVVQVKTAEKDKYTAVQLGFGTKKKPIKALSGHSKKAGIKDVPALIREVAWTGNEELPKSGDVVSVESVFQPGDIVKVTGTSKGKGFAGGVKRYGFRGGPKTHGQSDRHRAPGSIGQGTTPGRVYKGKRMAGHMGVDTVTVRNLVIVDVDPENKKLYVLGLLPGNKKAMLVVTKIGEQKKFVRLLSAKLKEDEENAKEAERLAKEQEKIAAVSDGVKEEATANVADSKEEVTEPVKEEAKTEEKAAESVASEESNNKDSVKEETVSEEVSDQTESEQPTEEAEESAEEK
jgi:large subunit ribosomal protein L3